MASSRWTPGSTRSSRNPRSSGCGASGSSPGPITSTRAPPLPEAISQQLKDVIEGHKGINNYGFKADDIVGLIEGGATAGRGALWHELISVQLDADRMDYFLRDSHHAGFTYGQYDWRRWVGTITLVPDVGTEALRLGVTNGGRHAAEALIITRCMMFSQVYFH
jgi:HD superfamily phosphohydrolase